MSDTTFTNHYNSLGISSSATRDQIQAAIKTMRKTWVLRQNAPSLDRRQEAETMLERIGEAERVLLDPSRRATFDSQLRNHRQTPAPPSFDPPQPKPFGNDPQPEQSPYTYQQNAYEQDPYQRNAYQQDPYQQNAYQQNAYQQNAYQQNAYQQNAYQQNAYQQNAYQQNPYQQAGYTGYNLQAPNHPQGRLILWLGIAGIFLPVPFAFFAWALGSRAQRESRVSGIHPANQKQIATGRKLGMVWAVLTAIWLASIGVAALAGAA